MLHRITKTIIVLLQCAACAFYTSRAVKGIAEEPPPVTLPLY